MAEYIEREAAQTSCRKYSFAESYDAFAVDCILKAIPAADVVPVRHGEWVQVIVHVETDDGFVDRVEECCSACHEPNGRRCTYFCPNCGAKMDGGED